MNNPSPLLWLMAAVLLTFGMACTEAPSFPVEPVITFEGVNKGRVLQHRAPGDRLDSLIIQFSFTDGDGDLSFPGMDSIDVFLTDSRLPFIPQTFSFPEIDPEGTGSGISGTATITIVNRGNICCIIDDELCKEVDEFVIDTFSYNIQIADRAGNFSNVINTGVIEIACLNE